MPHPTPRDAGTEFRRAIEQDAPAAWASVHPHIPYDITIEESDRGSVVNGKFRLHPADLAARAAQASRVAA